MDPRVEEDPRAEADCTLFEIHDSVAIITINRPHALNAMNGAVRAALFAAFERVERDAAIVAAILTGAGERAFCAGVDLKEAAEMQLAVPPNLGSRANVRSVCGVEVGFVNRVVAPDALLQSAMEMADCIVRNTPLTVRAAKELVRIATEPGRSAALRSANNLFERVYRSADAQEGPLAFREKRTPRWQGQ